MIVNGIDTDADFGEAFPGCVAGRTLIVDGDGPCYVAAATAKRLDTAIRYFHQEMLKRQFMCGAQDIRVHLTRKDSDKHGRFRVKAVKPYQGQRDSKGKPALLEPLREAVARRENWIEEYDAVLLHRELEADDGMMQDAYRLKSNGVTSSEDKDLRMTPYPWYEQKLGKVMQGEPVGWVDLAFTEGGTAKPHGQGPLFFWLQMLAGDNADNIKGILKYDGKLCGPALAVEILKGVRDINVAANRVIDGYRAIDQNVLAEGWLLWLTRWPGDNVLNYFRELQLSEANRAFVDDCLTRDWVMPKEEFPDVPF